MMSPPVTVTKPEAGVTATKPATMPDARPSAVGLPRWNNSASSQLRPAAAAAACVAANAEVAGAPLATALPPLKPNHPNQRRPAPVGGSTMLLGWNDGR